MATFFFLSFHVLKNSHNGLRNQLYLAVSSLIMHLILSLHRFLIHFLWWLTLSVNLTGLRDPSKTLFLGVCARVLHEVISSWVSRMSKDDPLSPRWVDIMSPLRGCKEQKGRGEVNYFSLLEVDIHLFLPWHFRTSYFQAFGFQDTAAPQILRSSA